ncbi:MAG: YitT family protein [Syntrophaceae bacterium]|nr:YitT family protein [Syntrophaceae bacterium]
MNIPLTIIGVKILGPRFGVKTVVGFVLTSIFMDAITYLFGEAPLVAGDALLSSIFGDNGLEVAAAAAIFVQEETFVPSWLVYPAVSPAATTVPSSLSLSPTV